MKALITGASSGIGQEMAIYLSNLGYDLILVARNQADLKALAKTLPTKSQVIALDLSVPENCFKLYNEVKGQTIDIVINNAGFGLFGKMAETDLNRELTMIDLNIKAVHILTKLFLQDFTKRNKGYIMNVASAAGFMAGPGLSTYYATKNYVLKLTLAIYEELRTSRSKVHVCTLCPGPVKTSFNKVAGGNFKINGVSSKFVAQYAIAKMFENKLIIIPTLHMKLVIFLSRFLPTKLLLKIIGRIQNKKRGA